ncbi:hypothetical protein M9H77_03420 [Catharanthus roseus]|uniref:Uncharacterized protein n=1 Tax=Catharanthus roseus TaxID=4058 RepID=A0ACC0CB66_CATRO|nr:hypothetical protein M9H77_03420 [Catharanthus roseus]
MNPNLWRVQMTMMVASFYEEYQIYNFTLYNLNNDDEMRYLLTSRPDISKQRIHVLFEFEPIQSKTFSEVQHTHISTDEDHLNIHMGLGKQIDDLIELGTIRLLDWNDAMTDLQLGMRFVEKIQAISAVQKWSIWIG